MAEFSDKPGFRFDPAAPPEALEFFRRKGWRVGFDFRDVWREEHAFAFTVAKAMNLDVLGAIRGEIDRALAEGRTFRDFQKDLTPTLQKLGWWGRKTVTDPKTGEPVEAQLGSPRRLRTIYRANLRTARAAGQWERIERNRRSHPFLLYRIGPSKEHREAHVAWDGLILAADDPFWDAHMPPNGWGCKCRVRQVSRREAERLREEGVPDLEAPPIRGPGGRLTGRRERKLKPVQTEAPPARTRAWRNKRTGRVERVPAGIDPGWDTNPGKARARPLTPPERDDPPESFPFGITPPALPAARPAPEERLLPEGETPETYGRAFLGEFGADVGKPVVHVDRVGEPLLISDALLRDFTGRWKTTKQRRGPMMRLLADTVKEPDEIWWSWQKLDSGEWELFRQYLGRWEIAGQPKARPAFALFTWGNEGWSGVTTFAPNKVNYLLKRQRQGVLAYRREE